MKKYFGKDEMIAFLMLLFFLGIMLIMPIIETTKLKEEIKDKEKFKITYFKRDFYKRKIDIRLEDGRTFSKNEFLTQNEMINSKNFLSEGEMVWIVDNGVIGKTKIGLLYKFNLKEN